MVRLEGWMRRSWTFSLYISSMETTTSYSSAVSLFADIRLKISSQAIHLQEKLREKKEAVDASLFLLLFALPPQHAC